MAVIEDKYWKGEPLKAVIKFDESTNYTVYTNNEQTADENWIYNASFSLMRVIIRLILLVLVHQIESLY